MTEEALHLAVAQYLRLALRRPVFWTSIDHGAGKLSRRSAGMAKARGVKAGLPDIMVFSPADMSRRPVMSTKHPGHPKNPLEWGPLEPNATLVLGIELKIDKGRLSPAQAETHADMMVAGVRCRIARSVDDVEEILRLNGVPVRARLAAVAEKHGRAA